MAIIVRGTICPEKTTFVTPPEFAQQVGFVCYPRGGEIPRHVHRPVPRRIEGTSEVLVVGEGRCAVDLFDKERNLLATRELAPGDVIIIVGGGHGFRMLEDTVLLEVKQGPYVGDDEKEHF
ncbi:MAG: hypothetical protein JSU63_21815 [Phycisphaerales bacterium]|nr:MAG: hypothetical protein JSU63_21815 [Phycisphaerales bacterium]